MTGSVRNFFNRKLNYLLSSAVLFSFGAAQAQGPVAGYKLLNTPCAATGHYYYISDASVAGSDIAATVNAFRASTGLPVSMAYAAAIATGAENLCITNALKAHNLSTYGSELVNGPSAGDVPGFPWGDPHNAWIGYTDAAVEQSWVWSNGQPNCNKFENWNFGEPNDFPFGAVASNGEDFAEILLMKPYTYVQNPNRPTSSTNPVTGTTVDPLGRWNDWFNRNIQFSPGVFGGTTTLPLVIEVGPQECQPPSNRGTLGCSHGYWKNAKDAAWGIYAGVRNTPGSFVSTFNITSLQASVRGVLANLSLQDGLELQASGYNQVAKQGIAALLNAYRGFYPYTENEIRTAVKEMFNTGTTTLPVITLNGKTYGGTYSTPGALASDLDLLNNLGCPLNNKGVLQSTTSRQPVGDLTTTSEKELAVSGYPNPSRSSFSIRVDGLSAEKVSIRVTDMTGRLVEQRTNVAANQVLQIGSTYKAGMYYVDVMQGGVSKQLKLTKQ
ncbi:MAG TPA: T9SS type A sorting domain-containing protein [Flavisolibacter sp.]|nr:T9SS type A sorting domain-containing protein [Flavisolibacter sp.]